MDKNSKNPLLKRAMRTLKKMVKVNFLKTLEINQKLASIWRVFIQDFTESQFVCFLKSELCGILTCPSPRPLSHSPVVALETKSPQSQG